MNREIKFRAFCPVRKQMVEVNINDGKPVLKGYQWFNSDNTVHNESPMQFTGLYDKNGKEIYEGDVVNGNHKDSFIIIALNGGLQMLNISYYGQKHNELIASSTCDPQTKSWLEDSKIIGNIYEHPELLK